MQEIRGFQALHPLLQEGAPASHKIFCRRDLVPSPQLTASRHIGLVLCLFSSSFTSTTTPSLEAIAPITS